MARILVAEDDEDLQQICRLDLEELGHEVRTVADGHELIQMVKEDAPDLLVLDIMLPHRSGAEVMNTVRSLCPDMAIVIHTGYDRYEKSPIHELADAFVMKSTTLDELLRVIEKLLQTRRGSGEPSG